MTASADEVVCVIVHYRDLAVTLGAVEAVRDQAGHVLVVDQSEIDGDTNAQGWPSEGVERIERVNKGFAAGVNAGVASARQRRPATRAVWILNPDARPAADALRHMLDSLQPMTAVGCCLRRPDGAVEAMGGGRWSWWRGRAVEAKRGQTPFSYLCAASMLVHVDTLDRVGSLDESFFLYGEDVDWGLRMTKAGVTLAVADQAIVTHESGGGGAASVADYYEPRNALWLTRRYRPHCLPVALVCRIGRGVLPKLVRGQFGRLRKTLHGLRDGIFTRLP